MVSTRDALVNGRWVIVLLRLGQAPTADQPGLVISFVSPDSGSADFRTASPADLQAVGVAPNGLSGTVHFRAGRLPDAHRSPPPEFGAGLVGTLDWTCR